jgi:hypothetical protein
LKQVLFIALFIFIALSSPIESSASSHTFIDRSPAHRGPAQVEADDASSGIASGIATFLGEKLGEFLSELFDLGFQTGASNFDLITLSGSELGLDPTFINSVVIGINRQLEKNPFAESEDEKYLVKDTVRVGIRLGLGLVVSGDVGLVREYTLVYPRKGLASALLAKGFIFNPFLPINVMRNKLPEKFTLMVDFYLEGRGKLDLGAHVFLPIGSEVSLSRIRLKRHMITRKSQNIVNIISDKSRYTRLAQSVYLRLGLIKFPLFDVNFDNGQLDRTYYQLNLDKPGDPSPYDALDRVIKKQDTQLLRLIGRQMTLKDDFTQRAQSFSVFGLVTNRQFTRVSDISEDRTPDQSETDDMIRRYQIESFNHMSWTLGYKGEKNQSHVLTMMEVDKEKNEQNPVVEITLNTYDNQLKRSELNEWYLPLANTLGGNENFISKEKIDSVNLKTFEKMYLNAYWTIHEKGIRNILEKEEQVLWKELEEETGRSRKYWLEKARQRPQVSRRIRNERTTSESLMAKKIARFFKAIEKAKEDEGIDKWNHFGDALKEIIYISKQTWNKSFFSFLERIAGRENIFSKVQFFLTNSSEKKEILIENQSGVKKESSNVYHKFNFDKPSDYYYLFDDLFRVSPSL